MTLIFIFIFKGAFIGIEREGDPGWWLQGGSLAVRKWEWLWL